MEIEDQEYGIDESLLSELAWALKNHDKRRAQEILPNIYDRINGKCFCAAHSSSECCCGAWDGIWGRATVEIKRATTDLERSRYDAKHRFDCMVNCQGA